MFGMTRKLAISVPDDVAERLDREGNVSAFIVESVRRRMRAESVRQTLTDAGFTLTDEGIAAAGRHLDELRAAITPEVRQKAAEIRARLIEGRP
jgi:hypothetical protein